MRDSDVVVGVDFGTLSGRAVVVRAVDGELLGSAACEYPHGVLDRALPGGRELPADWALQVPSDYLAVFAKAVPEALRRSGVDADQVRGLGVDFTACTALPTLSDGTPLCELPEFGDEPHAFVKLWRHHAAQPYADRINAVARERGESWLRRYGGSISSEWQFAKGLQILEEAPQVYRAMAHLVEAADWVVWRLTGEYVGNAALAGFKGIYQDGGYPAPEFLRALNPGFDRFAADKLAHRLLMPGEQAGELSGEFATVTGLPQGVPIAVGNIDAHVTASAVNALEPGQLVAVMGTSTCHVVSDASLHEIPGVCGVVAGGVVADAWGYEAGQSGVGDILAWFVDNCVPPHYHQRAEGERRSVHDLLSELAGRQAVGEHGLIALDWHSGNRSVLVDHQLAGLLVGQTLSTRAEDIYRALMEATAFGARVIVEQFAGGGVDIHEVVTAGGLVRNRVLMQIYADVFDQPLSINGQDQAPALGAAIHASVAAGIHPDVRAASKAMGRRRHAAILPDPRNAAAYQHLFQEYVALHDRFGRADLLMHRLRDVRRDPPRPLDVAGWQR